MQTPESYVCVDDGTYPNSRHPALVYRAVLPVLTPDRAAAFERLFEQHDWPPAWRNGLYSMHHYHSTAHEVLGVYKGWVDARLGGKAGVRLKLQDGDVIVIPAGVAHCNEGQSDDFRAVGAYARGAPVDMQYGKLGERPATDRAIAELAAPTQDPVLGKPGPLIQLWKR
jgi:uncharacterized protein YjlB